jgi:DNA helicase HerA-like ATPase
VSEAPLPAYEKLGVFYLGRAVDAATGETSPAPFLYDAADLTTHALVVGMTGSGKTGLLVSLLEEAALDGVPALVVDPKGDLANLLLTFPDLAPADFVPWVDPTRAAREGLSVEELAAREAAAWREGLARWDQDAARLRRLRAAADFAVYTPGSTAGRPVSVLASFAAPPAAALADTDLVRDRVAATVGSLLGLLGVAADPLRSREHILLSLLFEGAWREGRDLDLGALIAGVQQPPVERVGVMPLETFFPAADRFALSMALNNLLASPTFAAWLEGEPLEVPRLLYAADGRPRVAVFSLAHLSEAERMFFVSLLLAQVLGWVRGLPGSSSLRALLAIDEVFGYLPPVAEPPSKRPLLTLLKQARAYGLGVVLATQNPVDLDYKGLGNIGTWFLGRLQTQRDKDRLLDGLESAGGTGLPRAEADRLLSTLDKRVFLLHNVHEPGPVLLRTRWAMSYLAGPLTRDQLRRLRAERPATAAAAAAPAPEAAAAVPGAPERPAGEATRRLVAPAPAPAAGGAPPSAAGRPVLPPDVPQAFLPAAAGSPPAYRPCLLGLARVHFVDDRRGIDHAEELVLVVPFTFSEEPDWEAARPAPVDERALPGEPAPGAAFAAVPGPAAQARSYAGWGRQLGEHLYRVRRLELAASPPFDLVARPGEAEGDFRLRVAGAVREARDAELAKLREGWARRLEAEREKVRRAEQAVDREREQAVDQKRQAWFHAGSTLLGALVGRKALSSTSLHRAGTALRGFSRSGKEAADVGRAAETLELRRSRLDELAAEAEREAADLAARYDPTRVELATVTLKPRKSDVEVRRVLLAWVPE